MSAALLDTISVSGNWVWPKGRAPLLVTNHGSHLYGTAAASSDRDIYCVVTRTPESTPRHDQSKIVGTIKRTENGVDVTMIDLGTWLGECRKGVPQALEAMFAPAPEFDRIADLRARYQVGPANGGVWDTYLRTIKAFAHADAVLPDGEEDPRNFKRKVHSLRLAWNMSQMRSTGRFDPVLHPLQVEQYRKVVEQFEGDLDGLYDLALRVAWK